MQDLKRLVFQRFAKSLQEWQGKDLQDSLQPTVDSRQNEEERKSGRRSNARR
jgi:hypothetical protein